MKNFYLFLVILSVSIIGCETDVNVNADYKEIPVIYALIDPTDTIGRFQAKTGQTELLQFALLYQYKITLFKGLRKSSSSALILQLIGESYRHKVGTGIIKGSVDHLIDSAAGILVIIQIGYTQVKIRIDPVAHPQGVELGV